MKSFFYGNANKSGVYKIINIENNRIYYGSCKRFKQRAYEHKRRLIAKRHSNKFLQNDFNKCGEEVFEFHVVEVVEGQKRKIVEQKFLDEFYDNQDRCYNIKPKTVLTERDCFSRTPEETRKKISEAAKKSASKPEERKRRSEASKKMWKNPEYRKMMSEKLSKAKKGKKRSAKMRKKMSENMKKRWADPEISKKYLNSFMNENFKKKMRKIAIENKYQPSFAGRTHTEASRKIIAKKSKEMWASRRADKE